MRLEAGSIDLAVLQLMRELGTSQAQMVSDFSTLQRRWTGKGMRRLDLPLALHRLQSSGCVRLLEGPAGGYDVELTQAGALRMTTVPRSLREMIRRFFDEWRLAFVQLRRVSTAHDDQQRRQADQARPDQARSTRERKTGSR